MTDVKPPHILIVDDDPVLVGVLIDVLAENGHQVSSLSNQQDIRGFCKEQAVDLIILDLLMPGKSGEEVLEELKANAITALIPVVVLTVVHDKQVDLLHNGAADYLVKPFDEGQLLAKIRRILSDLNSVRLQLMMQFTGAVCHEINNPLGILIGHLEVLNRDLGKSLPDACKRVDKCLKAADQIADITRKIRTLKEYKTQSYVGDTTILDFHGKHNNSNQR